MIIPLIADITSTTNIASILSLTATNMVEGTTSTLLSQWSNPADISTILMVIGSDVVQKALAQGTGVWYLTPVCFSFGCVSYAFTALVNIIGSGRLLPEPDYPVKVFNLESGYGRENKNWVVGRILRDIETSLSEEEPLADDAIRISVYEAAVNRNGLTHFSLSHVHLWGLACILVQLGLATIPVALARREAAQPPGAVRRLRADAGRGHTGQEGHGRAHGPGGAVRLCATAPRRVLPREAAGGRGGVVEG